jgi:exo-beta-1,3-glucanase (GH17 family)
MSRITEHSYQRLAGVDLASVSSDTLKSTYFDILREGIHGIAFSVYLEGQGPGSQISEQQVRDRMKIIQPHVRWIRSFSCVDGNEIIPRIAKEFGLSTLVGAWLGDDQEKNENEIRALIEVARSGYADMIAVGNEVLLRGDLSEQELIDYMTRVKSEVPDLPVGYVDAYFLFTDHPAIADACDVILINCYPFWEECPIEHSLVYMKEMYRQAIRAAKGKDVIITETGWPNLGSPEGGAVPSTENALKYFIDTYTWAIDEGIEVFYFSSFDETWKIAAEGDVGAYWGIWDHNGNLKYL